MPECRERQINHSPFVQKNSRQNTHPLPRNAPNREPDAAIVLLPTFDVRMMSVFLKLTVRPCVLRIQFLCKDVGVSVLL